MSNLLRIRTEWRNIIITDKTKKGDTTVTRTNSSIKKRVHLIFILCLCTVFVTCSYHTAAVHLSAEQILVRTLHGDYYFDPDHYDFGQMLEGRMEETTFAMWRRLGCNVPTMYYEFEGSDSWIQTTPESGTNTGERDVITVSIDTTGLSLGRHIGQVFIHSNLGEGMFWIYVDVVEHTPILKIGEIKGGLGKIRASLENVGDEPAHDVQWTMSLQGGIFQRVHSTATSSIDILARDQTHPIETSLLFGFGRVDITISTEASDAVAKQRVGVAAGFGFLWWT